MLLGFRCEYCLAAINFNCNEQQGRETIAILVTGCLTRQLLEMQSHLKN